MFDYALISRPFACLRSMLPHRIILELSVGVLATFRNIVEI